MEVLVAAELKARKLISLEVGNYYRVALPLSFYKGVVILHEGRNRRAIEKTELERCLALWSKADLPRGGTVSLSREPKGRRTRVLKAEAEGHTAALEASRMHASVWGSIAFTGSKARKSEAVTMVGSDAKSVASQSPKAQKLVKRKPPAPSLPPPQSPLEQLRDEHWAAVVAVFYEEELAVQSLWAWAWALRVQVDEQQERRTIHTAIVGRFGSLARAIRFWEARWAERKALIASELKGLEAKWGAGRQRIVLERHEEALLLAKMMCAAEVAHDEREGREAVAKVYAATTPWKLFQWRARAAQAAHEAQHRRKRLQKAEEKSRRGLGDAERAAFFALQALRAQARMQVLLGDETHARRALMEDEAAGFGELMAGWRVKVALHEEWRRWRLPQKPEGSRPSLTGVPLHPPHAQSPAKATAEAASESAAGGPYRPQPPPRPAVRPLDGAASPEPPPPLPSPFRRQAPRPLTAQSHDGRDEAARAQPRRSGSGLVERLPQLTPRKAQGQGLLTGHVPDWLPSVQPPSPARAFARTAAVGEG